MLLFATFINFIPYAFALVYPTLEGFGLFVTSWPMLYVATFIKFILRSTFCSSFPGMRRFWLLCYLMADVTYKHSRHLARKYINNIRHLARKYARIFVRGHYLFREANSFPSAMLEENCELRGTDNVQGQISEHIFAPNGDYCLYYPPNLLRNARSFENWGVFSDIFDGL